MKLRSTLFLRLFIYLLGIAVLSLCVFVLPSAILSGKAGAYLPILYGMYIPAIPFFIGLAHGLRLLRYIDAKHIFSSASVKSLRILLYCSATICACYTLGMPYIFYVADQDDAPGVVAIACIFILASLVVATAAAIFQRVLQHVIAIKSENELTV